MKKNSLLRLILASLALAALSHSLLADSFLKNPSFESNYNDTYPHYGSIDEWTGGSGIDEDIGPFHNTGTAIPDQTRVAFIQGADKTMSQDIAGLTVGKKYWIQFFYDARGCCGGAIDLVTKFNDTQLDNIVNVKPAANPAVYYFRSVEFTADADQGTFAFATAGTGDATVLVDAVTIVQRDSGNAVIMNPSFEASGDVPDPGVVTALAGWTISGTVGISGADNGAVPDQDHVVFLQGTSSITQVAPNLVSGKSYQLSFAYNARTGTTPHLQVKVGGKIVFEEDVTPVGGTSPFKTKTIAFDATDITADITFAQSKDGTDVLLLDDVKLLGETAKPLPPLTVSPALAEMSVGEQLDVKITVPAELLAIKAVDIVLQTSGASVVRFTDPSGALLSGAVLHFDKGGTNEQSAKIQTLARGSAIIQVIDAAGLKVANQLAVTVVASSLKNPSFESTPVPGGVGYGAIAGWTGGSGLNSPPGPFSDNGIVPDRKQVGFIQGKAALSQDVHGLIPGKNYWLQFFYNARNGPSIDLSVKLAGKELASIPGITAVGEGNPYLFRQIEFIADSPTATLEFSTIPNGDATLLLDGITIVQRDAGQIVVRNPSFEASGSVYPFPGYFDSVAGWNVSGGGRGVNIDGAGPFTDNGRAGDQDLVLFLQGNGASVSQNLTGLTDGKKYVVAFLLNARICCGTEDSSYSVSFADVPLLEESFTPVGDANLYLVKQATFTAAGPEGVLKFQGTTTSGDHTILIDNVVVIPETGSGPFLLAQPASASAATGGTNLFSVAAAGSGALSYQWKKDGQALTGETAGTLNLENITPAMAGDYIVEVKNTSGTNTSAVAHLTVLEAIAGVFDTGVGNDKAVLADGATDPHYTLVQNADSTNSTTVFVEDGSKWPLVAGPWVANSDLSKWVGPRFDPGVETPPSGPAGGNYIYRLNLDLTGYDPSSVVLSGNWGSDNSAELIINDLNTGLTQAGFATLASFSITGVFKPGVNKIDFKVTNGDATGGPTGLRVEGLTAVGAKAGPAQAAPSLTISRSGAEVKISWPSSATGYVLQSAALVNGPWTPESATAVPVGNQLVATVPITGSAKFLRLSKQ